MASVENSVDAGFSEDTYLEVLDDALQNHPRAVTSVDLSGNKINSSVCTDIAWKYIGEFPNLRTLDIKANSFGPEGWKALYATIAAKCPFLDHLDISENNVLDESMFTVAKLLVEAKHLTALFLVSNSLTPRGIPTLCDGLIHSHLKELRLDFNGLGDEGALLICKVAAHLPSLAKLGLSDNNIGDKGAKSIAALMLHSSNCHVEWIDLSVNKIGDAGLAAIGAGLSDSEGNRHLRNLDLSNNSAATSAGVDALLADADRWLALRSIELCSMALKEHHFKLLIKAISAPTSSLVYVEYFNNPGLSEETEKALSTAIENSDKKACDLGISPARRCDGGSSSSGICLGKAVFFAGVAAFAALVGYRFIARK